ncbi:MAG: PP0621 family protein [Rhizobacter sp.]|nr:PP0621 family protein [Rhizobacter sp.]
MVMKFVLILVVVLVLVWLLSGKRRHDGQPPAAKPGDSKSPQTMLACAVCGVHLPRDEALPGRGGVFCSEAHRKSFEQSQSGS